MELPCWGCCCRRRKKYQGLRKNHLSSKWTSQHGFLLLTSMLKKCSILVLVDFETEQSVLLLPISTKPKFQPLSSSGTHAAAAAAAKSLQELIGSSNCIGSYVLHPVSERVSCVLKAKVRLMTIQMRSHNQRQNVMVVKNVGSGSQALNPYSPQVAL